MKIIPYSALYIDISTSCLIRTALEAIKPSQDVKKAITGLENIFLQDRTKERLLITICVRSGLDLLLQGLNFPPGTEILMSAMNIPDMVKVVHFHGLIPVPIDLDFTTLKPKYDILKNSITKKTRAVILAWVFGSYNYAEDIYKLCKDNNLYIIEDNAEAFFDVKHNGSAHADATLFSFGTIKLNTSLGGGLLVVRNDEVLYRKMKNIMNQYPIQPMKFFLKRVVKALPVMAILNSTFVNRYLRTAMINLGIEYKEKSVSLLRGFTAGDNFLDTFRKQMPNAMIVFLYIRMSTFDKKDFLEGTKRQLEGQEILEKGGIIIPGSKCDLKYYWLYPVIVPHPEIVYQLLNKKGIDAYLGATQLKPVDTPVGYPEPEETLNYFDKILYLPIHKNVPREFVQEICKEVVDTVKTVEMLQNRKAKF